VNTRLVVVFLSVLISFASFAEEAFQHPTVVVEADKYSLDDVDPDSMSGHVTVISHEAFDTRVATVADVLRNETAVQIRQIGGLGSFSTVNIRGSNSKQVNVYLNGVLLNGAFGGSVDLSQFALDNVEQIEIYRGNTPVTLGFSGIGGAINIKTRAYSGESLRQIKLGYGSFKSKNVAAMLSDKWAGNEFFFSSEYLSSDNDFGFTHNNLTPEYSDDDFLDRRNNANFQQVTSLLSVNRSLSDQASVSWVSQYFDKNDRFPDVNNSELEFAELDTNFLSSQIKLDYRFGHAVNLGARFFASQKQEYYLDKDNIIGTDTNDEENKTRIFGLGFQSSYSYQSHLLSASLEEKVESYTKQDFKEVSFFKYRRLHSIAGLQYEWLTNDAALQINVGGRFFYVSDKSELIDKDTTHYYNNSHIGLLYNFNNSLQLHANVSRNVRIPQLFELYGDRGLFKGNNELLPEKAINADFGLRLSFDEFTSKASFYHRDLKDGIFLSYGSGGVGKAINISTSRVIGFEIDNTYQVSDVLSGNMKSTIQDSYEITASSDRDGNSLPGLYSISNFFSVSLAVNKFIHTLEYRHQSGGFFDVSNDASIPSQDQINFCTKWKSLEHSLEFRVDNLTDNSFLDFNRYPTPGRRFFVVFKKTF
jgi:iron complex outermembrane receptor protein